jgi:hypothetical protein
LSGGVLAPRPGTFDVTIVNGQSRNWFTQVMWRQLTTA